MMFLLTCDKKLTKSQFSPTHASTKRKITDKLKHNAEWYTKSVKAVRLKSSGQSGGWHVFKLICFIHSFVLKVHLNIQRANLYEI